MSMFNRRNAVIGYFALKALKRARRNATVGYLAAQGVERTRAHRRGRRALRLAFYLGLGVLSVGILAALAGFWRRQAAGTTEAAAEAAETGETVAAEAGTDRTPSETLADDVSDALESAPAT